MLPKLSTCDPNDPRNSNLFRLSEMLLPSQKSKDVFRTLERELQAVFRVPGTNTVYNNYYALEQPRRHQLLKLRMVKPTLFSGAIPISEDVIKKDENYRAILAAERRRHAEDEDTEMAATKQVRSPHPTHTKPRSSQTSATHSCGAEEGRGPGQDQGLREAHPGHEPGRVEEQAAEAPHPPL
jgi:hypothetical protein